MKRNSILLGLLLICMAATAQTTQQADSLHQRGRELVNEGKVVEGRECTRQAMEIRKKLLGEVSEDYITSLNNYAYSFGAEKNWQKAVDLQEQVMVLCGKLETPLDNVWYTIQGTRLNGKPQQQGIYLHGGKKVMIK